MAAADVLRSPDKTKTARFVFSLFLCLRHLPLICVYLLMTLPVFRPERVSTVQSGPRPKSTVEAFCLRQSHRRAVVECGAHGPEQIELNALPRL